MAAATASQVAAGFSSYPTILQLLFLLSGALTAAIACAWSIMSPQPWVKKLP
jgi:hypothetical protein